MSVHWDFLKLLRSYTLLPGTNSIAISSGRFHNCALTTAGHVFTWGLGSEQLGHGPQQSQLTYPQLVETLLPENGGGRVQYICAQSDHTCALTDVGDLFTWGSTTDQQGLLGHGAGSYQPVPKRVVGVKRAVQVASGDDHTVVLIAASLPPLPHADVMASLTSPQKHDFLGHKQEEVESARKDFPSKALSISRESLSASQSHGRYDRQSHQRRKHRNSVTDDDDVVETADGAFEDDLLFRRGFRGGSFTFNDVYDDDDDDEEGGEDEGESIANGGGQHLSSPHDSPYSSRSSFASISSPLKGTSPAQPNLPLSQTTEGSCQFYFQPPSLKVLCEVALAKRVDILNAANVLAYAKHCEATELFRYCCDFALRNLDAILVQGKPAELDILLEEVIETAAGPGYEAENKAHSSRCSSEVDDQRVGSPVSASVGRSGSISGSVSALRKGRSLSTTSLCSVDSEPEAYFCSYDASFWEKCKRSLTDEEGDESDSKCLRQQKSLYTLEGVQKAVKSIKKKLKDISELEDKLRVKGVEEVQLHAEQIEKIDRKSRYACNCTPYDITILKLIHPPEMTGKKSNPFALCYAKPLSLQSELRRLEPILIRLLGEER